MDIYEKIYRKISLGEAEKISQLTRFNKHKDNMPKRNFIEWLNHAIDDENLPLLEAVLDHTGVPANMTIKERISYYQLLKD